MRFTKVSVWAAGLSFLSVVSTAAQTQTPNAVRTSDRQPNINVAPEVPGTISRGGSASQAVIPRLMKFSGALLDSAGKPMSGAVDVTFSLYKTEAGGGPLWFETQSVQADELGRYTALLGAMHTDGLPLDLFTSGEVRWLGIQVGLEPEQQPRVLLVSVPYALKAGDAETLGGKPASAYMLSDSSSGTASASTTTTTATTQAGTTGKNPKAHTANTSTLTACAGVTSDGTAVATSIAMFTTACNIEGSNIYQSSGNIGIGTASPQALLDIENGSMRLGLTGTWPVIFNQSGGSVFTITNGGTNKLAFDPNGNLGVGTTTPGAKVDILGGNLRIGLKGTWPVVLDQSAGSVFTITNGGTKKLAFDVNGNLGVGTTSPAAKLDVAGNINIPQTSNTGAAGLLLIGGAPFLGACCGNNNVNTFVGFSAGNLGTTGSSNVGIGASALNTNTAGSYNAALGFGALQSNTDGSGNTAIGYFALHLNCNGATGCTGNNNTALGNYAGEGLSDSTTNVSGANNTYLGYRAGPNTATQLNNATAIGALSVVGASNALVLGSINGQDGATATAKVGIGTATPGDFLDINVGTPTDSGITLQGTGTSSFGDLGLKIHNLGTGGVNWYLDSTNNASGYGGGKLAFVAGPGNSSPTLVLTSTEVGIGTTSPDATLSVSGTADKTGGGSWSTFSDARLKNVEGSFHLGLQEILKLNPIIYRYKGQNALGINDHDPHVGFVAQEVEKVIPQAVSMNAQGYRLVNNDPILWTMLNAIKEQQAIIEKQQEQIARLASQVATIQASLKNRKRGSGAVRLAKVHAPVVPASGPGSKHLEKP